MLTVVFFVALLLQSVLALGISASKRESAGALVKIPMSRHHNFKGQNIPEADRNRARALIERARYKSRESSFPVFNQVGAWSITVGVGSPATEFQLIVDTGSSNTWIGANKAYVPTSTTVNTGQPVGITFATGFFSGIEVFDIMNLGPGFTFNQSIGNATSVAQGSLDGLDGIMGIGPTDLTNGSLGGANELIPTVVDSMRAQGLIRNKIVSVFLKPTFGDDSPIQSGQISFGDIDYENAAGPITFVPITSTSPSNLFWGINASATVSGKQIFSNTAGIVDTGTAQFLLASDAFQTYQEAVGATFDDTTGFLRLTKKQFLKLPTLSIHVGGTKFEITPDAQALPQKFNFEIGGDNDHIYLIVLDLGTPSGEGLDFVIGQAILQRIASYYDTDHRQVGLSTTEFTYSIANVVNLTMH